LWFEIGQESPTSKAPLQNASTLTSLNPTEFPIWEVEVLQVEPTHQLLSQKRHNQQMVICCGLWYIYLIQRVFARAQPMTLNQL
jgi:hypothetical protein